MSSEEEQKTLQERDQEEMQQQQQQQQFSVPQQQQKQRNNSSEVEQEESEEAKVATATNIPLQNSPRSFVATGSVEEKEVEEEKNADDVAAAFLVEEEDLPNDLVESSCGGGDIPSSLPKLYSFEEENAPPNVLSPQKSNSIEQAEVLGEEQLSFPQKVEEEEGSVPIVTTIKSLEREEEEACHELAPEKQLEYSAEERAPYLNKSEEEPEESKKENVDDGATEHEENSNLPAPPPPSLSAAPKLEERDQHQKPHVPKILSQVAAWEKTTNATPKPTTIEESGEEKLFAHIRSEKNVANLIARFNSAATTTAETTKGGQHQNGVGKQNRAEIVHGAADIHKLRQQFSNK